MKNSLYLSSQQSSRYIKIMHKALRNCCLYLAITTLCTAHCRAEKIAFFYALDADLTALKGNSAPDLRTIRVGSTVVQNFTVGRNRVWAAKMGVGNVDTAVNAAALLSKFPCDVAISTGPAGALSDKVRRLSWYVIDSVVGYQRGTFGPSGFTVSPDARVVLPKEVFDRLANAKGSEGIPSGERRALASGDAFIAQSQQRTIVRDTSGADLVDMNTFGLATACSKMKAPLVVWRVVSDSANEQANEDFRTFVADYDGLGGRRVREMLLSLPPSQNSVEAYDNIRKALMQPSSEKVP
jgi:nucleoside phosphorylase